MFEINSSKRIYHANDLNIFNEEVKNSYPYVVRSTQNNGVRGYIIQDEEFLNPKNTLSFAQDTFSVFFQEKPYYTGNKVKVLFPKFNKWNRNIAIYISSIFQKSLEKFTWGTGSTVKSISNIKVFIPTKNGEIDFDFMDAYISELEEERISELTAYLKVSGLANYELSTDEIIALENFNKIKWKEYNLGKLFDRVKTKKLPYKAKDLPKEPNGNYVLPALTSSFMNQGLNYYLPKEGATVIKNVISIPSNSDVYRSYYQSRDFTVLSDAYAIEWKNQKIKFEANNYIFTVPCINKVTDLPIYSYKNKLGGWNVVKNKKIHLPINKNGEIAYEFMRIFIQAIKKSIIKEVVTYSKEKVEVAKTIVKNNKL